MTASVLIGIVLSMVFNKGKFLIDQILFCTIAGGVMIANCADMYSFPFPSLIIGLWAGAWSTSCHQFLPQYFSKWKFFDTTNVLITFGFPGIWGNLASAITLSTITKNYFAGIQNA